MNYLVVCNTEGKFYLLMTKDGNYTQYAIQAYDSKDKVMESFKGYTDKWMKDYTWNISACLGMMQMRPVAIEAIEIDILKEYIISMNLTSLQGGFIGRGYTGLEVKEDILKFKQFDIWNQSMVEGGYIEK